MIARLNEMKAPGASKASYSAADGVEDDEETPKPGSAARNNNVVVILSDDGNLYLRNEGFWDELPADRSNLGASIPVDWINVALYPPAASAQRSMLARAFVGYLGRFVGREKVHELRPWADVAAPAREMRRPTTGLPIGALKKAVAALGGPYPQGEVVWYHVWLNFLSQQALRDPVGPVGPVGPEWTDPSGLTEAILKGHQPASFHWRL